MKKLLLALILVLLVLPLTACGSGSSGTLEFELLPDDTYRVSGIGTFNGSVLEIPSSYEGKPVTTIHRLAFGCESLTSVTIPDSVKSIGHSAFYMCESLTSVTIPDSVKSIGEDAFGGCTSLTSINVSRGNTNYKSIDGNLYNYAVTTLIKYAIGKTDESFNIPDSVTRIGEDAFSSCESLTSVTIPDRATLPSLHPQNNYCTL